MLEIVFLIAAALDTLLIVVLVVGVLRCARTLEVIAEHMYLAAKERLDDRRRSAD